MHPADIAALQLVDGDAVELASAFGVVHLPVAADDSVRRGVVSVPHGWGDVLDAGAASRVAPMPGANTNVLTSATVDAEPINAMPCLTGLRIEVRATTPLFARERIQ